MTWPDLIDLSCNNKYDDMNQLSNRTNHVMIGTIHHELTIPDRLIMLWSIWFDMNQLSNLNNHVMIGTI